MSECLQATVVLKLLVGILQGTTVMLKLPILTNVIMLWYYSSLQWIKSECQCCDAKTPYLDRHLNVMVLRLPTMINVWTLQVNALVGFKGWWCHVSLSGSTLNLINPSIILTRPNQRGKTKAVVSQTYWNQPTLYFKVELHLWSRSVSRNISQMFFIIPDKKTTCASLMPFLPFIVCCCVVLINFLVWREDPRQRVS